MEKLMLSMSGVLFLKYLDMATDKLDREEVAQLGSVAFARKKITWQAAVRYADNYIIGIQTENREIQRSCLNSFQLLVPQIEKDI